MDVYGPLNVQDRTVEFQQCVSTFTRQSQGSKYKPLPREPENKGKSKISKSEFTQRASLIAKDIVRVTNSLSKLAQLAKRKQIFNDKPTDMIELTYVIKQDIFKIEKSLKDLQSKASSGANKSNDSQIIKYNKNVVQLLNTKTKNISETFKEVLQTRQRNELAQKSRQEQLLATVSSATSMMSDKNPDNLANGGGFMPYSMRSKAASSSDNPFLASLHDPSQQFADPDGPDINDYANGGHAQGGEGKDFLSIPDQSQQLLLLEEQNNEYLQDRNRAVEAIESTINEVGGLFQQLATMVQEQGEVIQRIDTNVEDINMNISGAHRELLKYYNTVSSNRWLMVKIFSIIIIFFLLWVLVS
ncbi:unnamed protein product [Ambrosiozyma monospora]|uniref:Unnamed protein product n=1 Tax=Ambrosiozyma monospora TaxID=43982 RepID=A0A9W6YVE5_AMBMO|nr:unnamed protein product [Ambrosiozyma monospora]